MIIEVKSLLKFVHITYMRTRVYICVYIYVTVVIYQLFFFLECYNILHI